jgi:hypothetical protein
MEKELENMWKECLEDERRKMLSKFCLEAMMSMFAMAQELFHLHLLETNQPSQWGVHKEKMALLIKKTSVMECAD